MKPIYLEPSEEITSIIERLSQTTEKNIAIVVPKNSTMFQSLVNLKLLARQAKKIGKTVTIISSNKVGTKLAKQVGLESYASLGGVSNAPSPAQSDPPTASSQKPVAELPQTLPDGTPVHHYTPAGTSSEGLLAASSLPLAEDELEIPDPEKPDVGSQKPETNEVESEAAPELLEASSEKPEAPSSLPPIVSRGVKTTREFNFVFPWKSALVAGAMILVALVITFLFLPKATVTMTFPAKLLSASFTIAAKTSGAGDGVIAGNLLTANKTATATVTATGKKDIGTKATGTVTIKNCEDSTSHALPTGTKLTASSKDFTTDKAVTVPAGQFSNGGQTCNSTSVSVDITASQAGDGYNLAGASFSISGLSGHFTASGTTTGGTTKTVTILSQDDVTKAYADLTTQTTTDATNDLKAKANGQTILDPAIKQTIQEQKIDKTVGSQTDAATASMTVELYTIAFDSSALETVAKAQLTQKLEANQQLVVPEDKKAAPTFKDISDDRTSLNLDVAAAGFAAPLIDKKAVAKAVKNKSVAKAEASLKDQYQADSIKIEVIPSWWMKRLPILAQAISVDYGFNAVPGT